MRFLTKIFFFIAFFTISSQVTGSPACQFEENIFLLENQPEEQPSEDKIIPEPDQYEDENSLHHEMRSFYISLVKVPFSVRKYLPPHSFIDSFWQPPK